MASDRMRSFSMACYRDNRSLLKKSMLVLFDQLTVSDHRVIPDIHAEIAHDFPKIVKTLQTPRQKILPLDCLNRWISRRIKVDHGTNVTLIPIPDWNPGHQVLFINETHELASQKTPVSIRNRTVRFVVAQTCRSHSRAE